MDYLNVVRGMVFWYDINSNVDKNLVPTLSNGSKDYLLYGMRPWVVVSINELNARQRTAVILPLHEKKENGYLDIDADFRVSCNVSGREGRVLCDQVRTVNCSELKKYICILSKEKMREIEDAMCYTLGLPKVSEDVRKFDDSVEIIEDTINKIIANKVEEIKSEKTSQVDTEDIVLRIATGLETLFDVKSENKKSSQVSSGTVGLVNDYNNKSEKPEPRQTVYNVTKKSRKVIKRTKESFPRCIVPFENGKRVWTDDLKRQYMKDVESLPRNRVMELYGCSSVKDTYQLKAKFKEFAPK